MNDQHAECVVDDEPEWNGLRCPYFARFHSLEGHDPEAVCAFGCYDEPACVTCEPTGGWPKLTDGLLEENAQEFVANYIQKGGQ